MKQNAMHNWERSNLVKWPIMVNDPRIPIFILRINLHPRRIFRVTWTRTWGISWFVIGNWVWTFHFWFLSTHIALSIFYILLLNRFLDRATNNICETQSSIIRGRASEKKTIWQIESYALATCIFAFRFVLEHTYFMKYILGQWISEIMIAMRKLHHIWNGTPIIGTPIIWLNKRLLWAYYKQEKNLQKLLQSIPCIKVKC